jgi:magnesium chelatase family protein
VGERCRCGEAELRRHQRRLSGPLLDRLDLLVNVQRPTEEELRAAAATTSQAAREHVADARERQRTRLEGTLFRCNGEMDARAARRLIWLEPEAEELLGQAYTVGALSARGRHRVLKVARTIADLECSHRVTRGHVLSALALRQRAGGGVEEVGAQTM